MIMNLHDEEREAYARFLSADGIGRLLATHIEIQRPRGRSFKFTHLVELPPERSAELAIAAGTTWGRMLDLHFVARESGGPDQQVSARLGPFPILLARGTIIISGAELAPQPKSPLTLGAHLEHAVREKLTSIAEELRTCRFPDGDSPQGIVHHFFCRSNAVEKDPQLGEVVAAFFRTGECVRYFRPRWTNAISAVVGRTALTLNGRAGRQFLEVEAGVAPPGIDALEGATPARAGEPPPGAAWWQDLIAASGLLADSLDPVRNAAACPVGLTLRAQIDPTRPASAGALISAAAAARLGSVMFQAVRLDRARVPEGATWSADLHWYDDRQIAALDAQGVARLGVQVRVGDPLIGLVRACEGHPVKAEDRLLRGLGLSTDVVNHSAISPVNGTVVARVAGLRPTIAEVTVASELPLLVGDQLATLEGVLATLGEIADLTVMPEGLDLVLPADTQLRAEAVHNGLYVFRSAVAERVWSGTRSARSLISRQPILGPDSGVSLTPAMLQGLAGAPALLEELTRLRSDDADALGRALHTVESTGTASWADIDAPENRVRRFPTAAERIEQALYAVGLELIVDAAGARLGRATSAAVRRRSSGAVCSAEVFQPGTIRPAPAGLDDPRVFGSVLQDSCVCGRLSGQNKRGHTCPRCRVTLTAPSARHRQFGHIELPIPVPHPWFADDEQLLDVLPVLPTGLRPSLVRGRVVRDPLNLAYTAVLKSALALRPELPAIHGPDTRGDRLKRSVNELFDALERWFQATLVPLMGGRVANGVASLPLIRHERIPPGYCALPPHVALALFWPWVRLHGDHWNLSQDEFRALVDDAAEPATEALRGAMHGRVIVLLARDHPGWMRSMTPCLGDVPAACCHPADTIDAPGQVIVYAPMTEEALAEIGLPLPAAPQHPGWLTDAAEADRPSEVLVAAVNRVSVDSLTGSAQKVMAGRAFTGIQGMFPRHPEAEDEV